MTATYLRGLNLISRTAGTATSYYSFNAHGDVVKLTNAGGAVTKSYDYDAETGPYYLRARYYAPTLGRFTQQDTHWNTANMIYGDDPQRSNEREDALGLKYYSYAPQITAVMQSGNLYVYGVNDPLLYKDPSGRIVMVDDAIVLIVLSTGAAMTVAHSWVTSPDGQKAISEGAKVIYNGIVVVGGAISAAVETVMDSVVSGTEWVVDKATDAWTWVSGLFLAKNTYGDKTVEEVLKTKRGSIKNAPLPPGGPSWSDLLPLSMETVRRLAQQGETGYREIWKLLTDGRFNK